MDGGLDLQMVVLLGGSLLAAGLIMGFVSGLLGIGGGGILVPVLYEVFTILGIDADIRMHMALGTSLAVIVPTSLRSLRSHWERGTVDVPVLKRVGPFVVLGVVLGVVFADRSGSDTLKWVWVIFGFVLAAKMAFGRDDWRIGTEIPRSLLVEAYFVVVGFISVLMSIGGGAFTALLFQLYNRPLINAVSTSAGLGTLIALPGALGLIIAGWGDARVPVLSLGYVSVIGAAMIIPGSVFAAPFGVRMAHGISRRTLELCFAAFLAIVALRFLVSLG